MVHQWWYNDTNILSTYCSPEIETLIIKCRPYYLPREFTSVVLIGVYIPSQANAAVAIGGLTNQVTAIENALPDSHVLVQGDFNHTSLKEELPRYKQRVKRVTREGQALDRCHSTIRDAFHAVPRGASRFLRPLLPSYHQKLKTEKAQVRYVRRWNSDSVQTL